jgi:hypothetical protein
VVLLGIVGSPEEVIMAIALAQDVEGVQEVKSFLRSTSRSSDSPDSRGGSDNTEKNRNGSGRSEGALPAPKKETQPREEPL